MRIVYLTHQSFLASGLLPGNAANWIFTAEFPTTAPATDFMMMSLCWRQIFLNRLFLLKVIQILNLHVSKIHNSKSHNLTCLQFRFHFLTNLLLWNIIKKVLWKMLLLARFTYVTSPVSLSWCLILFIILIRRRQVKLNCCCEKQKQGLSQLPLMDWIIVDVCSQLCEMQN